MLNLKHVLDSTDSARPPALFSLKSKQSIHSWSTSDGSSENPKELSSWSTPYGIQQKPEMVYDLLVLTVQYLKQYLDNIL